jgi:CO dehydrogenase maturation factor
VKRVPGCRTERGCLDREGVMKIAVAGKGGSGKTTLAGTLARVLGRRGQAVLAVDADTNPNLAITMGIPHEAAAHIPPVPKDVLREQVDASGYKSRTLAAPYQEVLARYSIPAADNARLLLMGGVNHGGGG